MDCTDRQTTLRKARDLGVSEAFELAGAHVDKCTSVVGNACAWTAEILIDEGLLQLHSMAVDHSRPDLAASISIQV